MGSTYHADGLHEDFAQELSAIKIILEHGLERIDAGDDRYGSWETASPAQQAAFEQIRALAMELRPSGLDDFGLMPTIAWFCREFERMHPAIRIDDDIFVQTNYAFGPLARATYRIIESACRNIARNADTDQISLSLRLADQTFKLTIDDTPRDGSSTAAAHRIADPESKARPAVARERTTLSGRAFSAALNESGGITLQANWPL